MRTLICPKCGNLFTTDSVSTRKKYCSIFCYKKAKLKRNKEKNDSARVPNKICVECSIKFYAFKSRTKLCSKECIAKHNSKKLKKFLDIPSCLEDASRKLDKNIGYVRVYVPMHPEANTWGYVYEHRVIAEQMIGRRLEKGEIVHHKNGKRHDNRPENLEVMTSSEHGKLRGQREEDKDI